jgi:hypothetical protein
MKASLSAYLLGTDSLQRTITTTFYTAGAIAITVGVFALLRGYLPFIGAVNPLKARAVIAGGASMMVMFAIGKAMDSYETLHGRKSVF